MLGLAMDAALICQAVSFIYVFVLSNLTVTRRFVQKTSERSAPLII